MVALYQMSTPLQEDFGAPARYISEYQAIFRHALDGQALDMLRIARDRYIPCLESFLLLSPNEIIM